MAIGAANICLLWLSPLAVSVGTFGAMVLVGVPLTPGAVFTAIATFRILQPLRSFPSVVAAVAQAMGCPSSESLPSSWKKRSKYPCDARTEAPQHSLLSPSTSSSLPLFLLQEPLRSFPSVVAALAQAMVLSQASHHIPSRRRDPSIPVTQGLKHLNTLPCHLPPPPPFPCSSYRSLCGPSRRWWRL
ncbi:unnamed protein product [Closterium sp. NIES-54]